MPYQSVGNYLAMLCVTSKQEESLIDQETEQTNSQPCVAYETVIITI